VGGAATLPRVKRPVVPFRPSLLSAVLSVGVLLPGMAAARPVALAGVLTSPRIETKPLDGNVEGLPVWFLPRLGVTVRNTDGLLSLSYGGAVLSFQGGRWAASGLSAVPITDCP